MRMFMRDAATLRLLHGLHQPVRHGERRVCETCRDTPDWPCLSAQLLGMTHDPRYNNDEAGRIEHQATLYMLLQLLGYVGMAVFTCSLAVHRHNIQSYLVFAACLIAFGFYTAVFTRWVRVQRREGWR